MHHTSYPPSPTHSPKMASFLVATAWAVLALSQVGHGFAPATTSQRVTNRPTPAIASPSSCQMFTGIVEEMGEVLSLETKDDMTLWDGSKGSGTEMVIKGDVVMDGAYLGCSISVNGVCLTATELDVDGNTFKVGLAPETLRKTNLGTYVPQSKQKVNLERASEIGGRNSGHFVQGHVDNVGTISDRWVDENSLFFKISFPYEYMRYVVPKGFIAIDGTSLTVCDVKSEGPDGENWFTFMLVEYTQQKIIIPSKEVGDTVNIEVDVLGKYSEQAWGAFVPKMEALEQKVKELEAKVMRLEGGNTGGTDSTGKEVKHGDVVPKKFSSSHESQSPKPETWVRKEQAFYNETEDLNPKRENRDNTGTDWVRTKQTFYDTNY
mmetsp:Transcript_8762/g.21257  ORF Transcript_8762/g.21257 Transcript_8762/m.21257 type:complete len:378 (+) Transcript_8762:76-1209(+)